MNGESGEPIQVAIIEDDAPTREGLAYLIDGSPGYRCAASWKSVEEALEARIERPPDVLLLDIELPGMWGSEAVELLRERLPGVQILMLTVFAERDLVFESVCRGACGYLLKKTPPAKILESIAEAREGGAPMSPEIARKIVTLFQEYRPSQKPERPLTPQEVRLLQLLSEGYSYQNIAARLEISVNTVRNYIRSIYEKLHVHSKSEAVAKALRSRIIT